MIHATLDVAHPKLPEPHGPRNYNRWIGLTWRHYYRLVTKPWVFAPQLAAKYGGLCHLMLFHRHAYVVNDPQLVHDVLVRRRDEYERADFEMQRLQRVLGNSILTSSGSFWRQNRRIVQSAFRDSMMPACAERLRASVRRDLNNWICAQSDQPAALDLEAEMSRMTMRAALETVLGAPPVEDAAQRLADDLRLVSQVLVTEMESLWPWSKWWCSSRRVSATQRISRYVQQRIVEYANHAPGFESNLLHQLHDAFQEDQPGRLPGQQIFEEALSMTLAANHTMSATLAWTWCLLLRHPQIYQRVIDEALAIPKHATAQEQVDQLPYTLQVVRESMRLFPAAWVLFAREAKQATELGGLRIQKGGLMFIFPFVVHRDPAYFLDPLRFDPDRFAGDLTPQQKLAYLPFGQGPHACIGARYAMLKAPICLSETIRRFHIEADGEPSLEIARDLAIRPKHGCQAIVRRR